MNVVHINHSPEGVLISLIRAVHVYNCNYNLSSKIYGMYSAKKEITQIANTPNR